MDASKAVDSLLKKIETSPEPHHAMQYAQALLNLQHAIQVAGEIMKQ